MDGDESTEKEWERRRERGGMRGRGSTLGGEGSKMTEEYCHVVLAIPYLVCSAVKRYMGNASNLRSRTEKLAKANERKKREQAKATTCHLVRRIIALMGAVVKDSESVETLPIVAAKLSTWAWKTFDGIDDRRQNCALRIFCSSTSSAGEILKVFIALSDRFAMDLKDGFALSALSFFRLFAVVPLLSQSTVDCVLSLGVLPSENCLAKGAIMLKAWEPKDGDLGLSDFGDFTSMDSLISVCATVVVGVSMGIERVGGADICYG